MIRKKNITDKEQHVCGECALASWVTKEEYPAHFDLHGRPITLKCSQCDRLVIRRQRACPAFIKRI